MEENKLVKYGAKQLQKVENILSITEKLLHKVNYNLIPYRKINKWGFCTLNKKLVIDCIYDYVSVFNNRVAIIGHGQKYGMINTLGVEIIPCVYDDILLLSSTLVGIEVGWIWGVIDLNSQKLIDCKYSEIRTFSEMLILAQLNGKWGLINKFDKVVVDFKYDNTNNISEGICPVKLNGKWGFLDIQGIEIIPCKYDSVGFFSEGLCHVMIGDKWGFIDKNDKTIIDFNFRWGPSYFNEGLSKVWIHNGHSGTRVIIDKEGNEVSLFKKYKNEIECFSDGLALLRCESQDDLSKGLAKLQGLRVLSGFINMLGDIIIPCIYEENNIGNFDNGIALISYRYCHRDESDTGSVCYYDDIGYINKNGVEYWDDGNNPQYYLDKYANQKSNSVHRDYEIYLCTKAIKLYPLFSKAYFNRAKAIIDKAKGTNYTEAYKTALHDLEKAIEIEPENSEYLYWVGMAKLGASDYQGAVDEYNTLLRMDSGNINLLINRAKAKRKMLDYSGAIMDYTSVLDLPNNKDLQIIDAYIQRGIVKLLMNNFSGAIADYNSVLKIAPSYIDAYILRGDARQKSGDLHFNEDWQFADEICKKNGLSVMDKSWKIEYLLSK